MRAFLANRLAMAGLGILVFFGLVAVLAPVIVPYSPTNINFTPMLGISAKHLLGTTPQGNDIFSQLVYGAGRACWWPWPPVPSLPRCSC